VSLKVTCDVLLVAIKQSYIMSFAGLTNILGLTRLAVWLIGNALASINVVALRQTRLVTVVTGWVTLCGRVNRLGM